MQYDPSHRRRGAVAQCLASTGRMRAAGGERPSSLLNGILFTTRHDDVAIRACITITAPHSARISQRYSVRDVTHIYHITLHSPRRNAI